MFLGHISKVVIKKENEMVNRGGFFLEIFSEASSYVRVSFRRFKGCLFNVFNRSAQKSIHGHLTVHVLPLFKCTPHFWC